MRSNKKNATAVIGNAGRQWLICHLHVNEHLDRVHDGVAGGHNLLLRNSFAEQILARKGRWSAVQSGYDSGKPSIYLFGKRIGDVPTAQPCFHMSYRNFAVEGS